MADDGEQTGFHICEINTDGTGFRQITSGNCNDVDPCYLPDGRIVFVSDRSGHHEYYHLLPKDKQRNQHPKDPHEAHTKPIDRRRSV